ncbi:flippase [Thermococcus sp. AM4]|uniref:flippase n=1 Tax=Thermococcus sp. (strain AM4) TaxID=246969 RepID=UPI00018710ED|nr:flippase [Thermococcus sp. AM4]EEB73823.1 capsular polysaccharide biosynthesis protein [Thermococcus sp. AM4]
MDEVNQALHRIARGTGIIFVGTVISMVLGFASRTLLARYFSTSQYGVFNLALTIFSITLTLVTLGFPTALPREIGFYRKKNSSKIKNIISTSLVIVITSSLFGALFLAIASGHIAEVFQEPRLNSSLKILALALPFSALTGVLIAISQGFGRVREKVYFQNIFYPTLWLTLVLIVIIFNLPFMALFYCYLLAQTIRTILLEYELHRLKLFKLKPLFDKYIAKKLLAFSIPLMISGILWTVMNWTDTIMVGYYLGSNSVGIYNAATPIARLIPLFLDSAAFLYPPLISSLYAQGKIKDIKRIYQILTKWVFTLTLPMFMFIFVFPETTIRFFFGTKYLQAAVVLRILAFGFMIHVLFGLNGSTLLVIGDTKYIMGNNLVLFFLNILLNYILIPVHGIEGAAMATAVSYSFGNILGSLRLYLKTRIHPFSLNYIKSLIISILIIKITDIALSPVPNMLQAIVISIVVVSAYFSLIIIIGGIDNEDIEILVALEQKLGINLETVRKILKQFVSSEK